LAVGDDDQAIYAFQGANHSHMLTFINQYRDVRVISLTRNYRSHSDILHVAHNISGQIEQRLHHNISNVDKLIKAENSELPENATIERHEFKSDVAQFGWVAKKIAELISKGVSPEQIAILAPRHRYLEPVIPYLGNLNVPVRYEKRENILEDNHIIKIVNMTKLIWALGNNDNDLANSLWPEILSYDFWKVPTEAIWKLSWDSYRSKDPWTKLIIDSSWGNKIGLFFVRMGNLSKHETLETMLDYLIGVNKIAIDRSWYLSPFYDYYFSKDQQNNNVVGFWSLLSNLTVLRQHMRDYAQSNDEQPLKIDGFLNFIESHKIANIKILNTSPYHESVSAVQVMTAYKAKGLEFEYVFVLACTDEVWGSRSKSKYSSIGLPPNISHIRYGGANDDERLRLLFVAITRAKHGLFLSSYIKNFADRPTTRLKYFNEVEIEDKIVSTILPKKYQNIISVDSSAPELDDFRLYWQKKHTNIEGITTLKNLLRTRLDRYQMSPTHLNAFIDTVYGGPESFFINTILRFPKAPTNKAIFGTVIHNVLEWIHIEQVKTHKLPSPKMIHKYYRDQLISQTLNKTNYQLLLEHGLTVIDRYIDKKASDFSQNDVHEYNFKNQGVIVGEAHLTGKIDKMIIDKKKRKITIVDYKTGDSYDKWSSTNIKLHKYKQQLYMYKLLVEGSYQFADYSVDSALLEFVEPDNEGNIVQLEIKYNNEELIRLKKLINVVWVHIHELRFPDISNYSHDIYGIKKFEEDLLNNKV
ncbi:ATP-dependent helicase, partial [Candidatus Saccharibacteria bacterium]|nr:ATP-dependent helicase [Candidatus Saccharibacteria bacterium]